MICWLTCLMTFLQLGSKQQAGFVKPTVSSAEKAGEGFTSSLGLSNRRLEFCPIFLA